MRSIEQTSAFKRDLKRESKGRAKFILKEEFVPVVSQLAEDKPLAPSYHDHPLTGNWKGSRECHLAPNLLLLYRLKEGRLVLVRLGSHAEVLGM